MRRALLQRFSTFQHILAHFSTVRQIVDNHYNHYASATATEPSSLLCYCSDTRSASLLYCIVIDLFETVCRPCEEAERVFKVKRDELATILKA